MIRRPATRYVQTSSGDHVAFQIHGQSSGQRDLLLLSDWLTNLDIDWEYEPQARFLERLGDFARVIRLDARGTGLSDPVSPRTVPTAEELVEDIVAVLDAAGSNRPAVFGSGEGGLLAMVLAATHPERVSA